MVLSRLLSLTRAHRFAEFSSIHNMAIYTKLKAHEQVIKISAAPKLRDGFLKKNSPSIDIPA
jgi:hypothetical protein